jgi:SAM-dependent methyltransferase
VASIHKENYLKLTYSGEKSSYPSRFCAHLFSKFPKSSKVLDIGCGNGDFTLELLKMDFDVQGIDLAECEPLKERHSIVDLQVDKYPFPDNHFDIVFSKSVIEHLREPDYLIDEAYRVLKPGGIFICLTPSWKHSYREQFYIDHTHCTPFTRYSLETICRLSNFEANCDYFYQLPILWKFPILNLFRIILNSVRLPYKPYDRTSWPAEINKVIRFSREAMLLCICKKPERK